MITINWYPITQNEKDIDCLINFESNIVYIDPEPAFPYFLKKYPESTFTRCPAFSQYLKNTFIICSPYDLQLTFDKDKKEIYTDRFGQEFFINNLNITPCENDPWVVHLPPRFVLVTEQKSPVMVVVLPLMIEENSFSVVPGTFDITKWIRPIEFAFQVRDLDKPIQLKRGQPLMMIKFVTENDEPVQLERSILTKEVFQAAYACINVKAVMPNKNLQALYKMANPFITKIKQSIFNGRNK